MVVAYDLVSQSFVRARCHVRLPTNPNPNNTLTQVQQT